MNKIETEYKNKFENLFKEYEYLLRPDEKIVQCLSKDQDGRFYNPAWFISNYGYLFSVTHTNIMMLKPHLKFGGVKSDCENKLTDYVKAYVNNIPEGQTPQYYYYGNAYEKKPRVDVPMHLLVNHYFPDDEEIEGEGRMEVHHKYGMDWNLPPQINNQAKKLQRVPEKVHKEPSSLSNMTEEKFNSMVQGAPCTILFPQGDALTDWVMTQLQNQKGVRYNIGLCDESGEHVTYTAAGIIK